MTGKIRNYFNPAGERGIMGRCISIAMLITNNCDNEKKLTVNHYLLTVNC
jgi:hypothetical protein